MRKTALITVLIFLWAFLVVAFFVAEEKLIKPPVERGNISSIENHVVRRLEQALAEKQLGSAAVAFISNGRIISERGFGIANIETGKAVITDSTLYLLSSLSKAVTSWGMMKLVQEKKNQFG